MKKLLSELNPFKASGPDGVESRFLKETADELAPAIAHVFQASLQQSTIPNAWRHALISPIYKPGKSDKSCAENYRPISLTSVTCKILEHIVTSNLMKHLDDNNILSNIQHGFRKRRSCETQLTLTINDFAKCLNNGKQIDSILLDFSKAFDKVDHKKLCYKLNHYGVRGNNLLWIQNFLHQRTQSVVLNGKTSSKCDVKSGVPQGTVLGPALFLVYINDLPENISSTIRLFADDTYMYRVIESKDDTIKLQNDLNTLIKWEKEWAMEFHPTKCKVLRITNKLNIITNDYHMHGYNLKLVDNAKYLGVTINKKLSWKPHVNNIVKKANQTRAFLQRNLRSCTSDVKSQCYHTYVRPIIEYASVVWDPIGDGNKHLRQRLEMVQRKAARFVCSDWRRTSSPTKMIKSLQWVTLENRRLQNRLKFLYKYQAGLIILEDNFLKYSRINARFQPVHARVLVYQNSFIPATINVWNQLPLNVAAMPLNLFTTELVKICV